MTRYIGIQHRVKFSAAGEARPTLVVIRDGASIMSLPLADEQEELDFVTGRLPATWREVTAFDKVADFPPHHIKWKSLGDESETPVHQTAKFDGKIKQMHKVPDTYEGLRSGDHVGMVLGGSGDYLALGLATTGAKIGATVLRTPPSVLRHYRARRTFTEEHPEEAMEFEILLYTNPRNKAETLRFAEVKAVFNKLQESHKGIDDTSRDAELLSEIVQVKAHRFYIVEQRDKTIIMIRERHRARIESMKARIACEQRLRQFALGEVFREAGIASASNIEAAFDRIKANDAVFQGLLTAEAGADKALAKALKDSAFFEHLRSEARAKGVGPAIMARIFSAVIDIRRFDNANKFVAFAGAHVLADGRFPRRRGGELANWHGDFRQALYLLADQWVKRPDSFWGQRLIANKAKLRAKHPEVIIDPVTKKKKYSDGHIHKMGIWRTITQFTEWLYKEWSAFEKSAESEESEQKVA